MVLRSQLEGYLNQLLAVAECQDYAPNGLQVEGRSEIRRLVTGVTASAALLEAAQEWGADAVLVHHGYFWKGEESRIVGIKARRLRLLFAAEMNLFAFHLPLDIHPQMGNNAGLARLLDLEVEARHSAHGVPGLLWSGRLEEPIAADSFARRIAEALARVPLHLSAGPPQISRIAWCSGGAEKLIEQAAGLGVDAFISGELSESTVHIARESGLHYFAAGHHATERSGVQALGAHLAERFELDHRYLEIDNPA